MARKGSRVEAEQGSEAFGPLLKITPCWVGGAKLVDAYAREVDVTNGQEAISCFTRRRHTVPTE
jgi:hypothetical protein